MGNLVFQATLGGQVNLVGPNTASTFNLNVPAVSSTIATLTGTETFTNKTLTSPTLTTPVLGTPASGTLTNCTSLPVGGITATGTPSSTTYLRGDSTWATISTSTNAITNGNSNVTVNSSGGTITAATAGTTAVTIDTAQNVGIGVTPSSGTGWANNLEMLSTSNIINQGTDFSVGTNWYYNSGYKYKTTAASTNIYQVGGTVRFQYAASGTAGSALTWSESMRIDSSGNLLVGATSVGIQSNNSIILNFGGGNVIQNHVNGTVSGSNYTIFGYNTSTIGSITQNGTTGVLYNLTSDYRLKNNPVALTGAKDFVMALQPKTWDWWDNSGKGVGFIAHEFMEVAKYSGHGEKDAVDADGNPIHQSIQPSSSEVMANIVALMQEQQALITAQAETINALTARIVALEAK